MSLLYLPAAILSIVITQSIGGAIWPVAWVRIMARLGTNYFKLVGIFILSTALWWIGGLLIGKIVSPVPLIGGLVAGTARTLLIFLQATFLGGFLRKHADDLAYSTLA